MATGGSKEDDLIRRLIEAGSHYRYVAVIYEFVTYDIITGLTGGGSRPRLGSWT